MSHIAMLLPREELVYQAQTLAKEHPSVGEVRCIQTENAAEEAAASFQNGDANIVARGYRKSVL